MNAEIVDIPTIPAGVSERKSENAFTHFIPFGYQWDVIYVLDTYDYSGFVLEIVLSGSVGSAKSALLAHIIVRHCVRWPHAVVAIGRKALGSLKKTLFREIIEHMTSAEDGPCFVERVDFKKKTTTAEIFFANGARIQGISWADGNFERFRSEKWSMLVIEELTENARGPAEKKGRRALGTDFMRGFKMMKARVGRISRVHENLVISATNPDEPEGEIYDYFIVGSDQYASRLVFYSLSRDNPYLRPGYIDQLMQDYSPLEAERYLQGKWISLFGKGIYHAYREEHNLRKETYEVDFRRPLHLTFDFNTADGKPQSCAAFQVTKEFFAFDKWMDRFHFFRESVIDNANWCLDNLEDFDAQGLFFRDIPAEGGGTQRITFPKVIIHGDASGKASTSNSLRSNYDLIKEWFTTKGIAVELKVPLANPALVKRWTIVNRLCQNALKEVRIFIYSTCPVLNQGMKLARKKEGTEIEDDSKRYQHISTALGYAVCYIISQQNRGNSKVIDL